MKKVSFIVYFPYQWFIYKNIYNRIPSGQREVIVDMNGNPGLQDQEVKKNIISLLERERVVFRILEKTDYFRNEYFQHFFSEVEVIVSCWELGCVSNKNTQHIKKVNTTYGLAKELTMLRPTRSIYDIILAYGKRDQQHFSLLTKSIAIGNPRLDNYYRGVIDGSIREKLSVHFDDGKKTVLYVPTHGDLGSFREMLPTFEKLSKEYNIIFKPHYFTLREDPDVVEKYRRISSLLVIDDGWDTIEVMAFSDVIVSDNSSSIFDAMQVDRPLIVCDFLGRHFIDVIHKNLRLIKRGIIGASTYSESFEQEIKSKGLVATIQTPSDLEESLKNIDEIDEKYKNFRKKLVRDNFEYMDGSSGERAADIIMEVYRTIRKHVRGILHHAYLTYNNRIYRGLFETDSKRITIAPASDSALVWVFCDETSRTEEVLGTLYSALNDGKIKHACISGCTKDVIRAFSQSEFSGRVTFFENPADGLKFVYSQLSNFNNLLMVKPNTFVEEVETVFNFKVSSKREVLFFSENVSFNPENAMSRLFYLLKYEILGFRSLAKNILITVSREQILANEMSAVLVDTKMLLEHSTPSIEIPTFGNILSFFITLDSLRSDTRFSRPLNDFALMPNFFLNIRESNDKDLFDKLVAKGLSLYFLGVPYKRWPDKKILKFIGEVFIGNHQYFGLLKLVLLKMVSVKKYLFIRRLDSFLKNLEKSKVEKG